MGNARRVRTPTLNPSRGVPGLLTDTVPPTLSGADTQDSLELSLKPQARSKCDPSETRSSGEQEVLQSLEAIKGQTPSRQGGVTQGAIRPSPADRPACFSWCSAPLRFRPIFRDDGILPLKLKRFSPAASSFSSFLFSCFPRLRLLLCPLLPFSSQPLHHPSFSFPGS